MCYHPGHYKSDCPFRGNQPGRNTNPYRSGRSSHLNRHSGNHSGNHNGNNTSTSRNALLETKPSEETHLNSLSIEQLEALIAVKRLGDECDNLPRDEATMNTVTVNQEQSPKAVDRSYSVCTCEHMWSACRRHCAQSTIISCYTKLYVTSEPKTSHYRHPLRARMALWQGR